MPASRSGAHSLPKSNKNNVLSTSHSKHNQIGQADIVQKSARIQDPFKNTKSSSNKAKAGCDSSSLSAKSPLQHPRRNMPNSTLEVCSSTNPQPPLVTKANCGLEVFPAAVLPPTGSRAPDACDLYRKTGAVPQNTHYIGGNMRDTQFQTIKPSGLRMPSPSLGFFCQVMSAKEMLFCLHRKYTRSLYPNRFGKRTIARRVVKESYGAAKQQHTFTEADKEKQKRETEEMGDAMKSLENRTLDSKREMDILAALG